MFIKTVVSLLLVFSLAACSTASKDISSSYVSPMQYQPYDCDQLAAESGRISSRVGQISGRLDDAASNDAAITTAGALIFWPVLFALGGTKEQEMELSRLKGEYDAVQQAAVLKKCPGLVAKSTEQEASK